MSVLTLAAFSHLAMACAPAVSPQTLAAIAHTESGFETQATHHNTNGTTDYGLLQINSANFGWLGVTAETVMEPCTNIRAGAAVLTAISRYNTGDPQKGFANGYVRRVMANSQIPDPANQFPQPAPDPNGWDVWGDGQEDTPDAMEPAQDVQPTQDSITVKTRPR